MRQRVLGLMAMGVLAKALLAPAADASLIVYLDDQFDSGSVGTNPAGVGDGFFTQGVGHSQIAGLHTISPANSDWALSSMYTKPVDDFPIDAGLDITALFVLNSFNVTTETSGAGLQVEYGLANTASLPGNDGGGKAQGSWQIGQGGSIVVQLRKDGTGAVGGTIQVTDSNSPTNGPWVQVAAFSFDTYDGSVPLDVRIILEGETGFAVELSEDVTVSSGALAYTWSGLDTDFSRNVSPHFAAGEELYAFVGTSNWSSGRGFAEHGRVLITAIPEPASLALVGLGGLVLLRRQRA
ncbi:MAG: PEP-CTERM sorting domain-containing protein [Phycisphaeraceae bacterium]|nr:PEP-CTERM sorting domain-containing protein [Phycisphaeraceae bacterium]